MAKLKEVVEALKNHDLDGASGTYEAELFAAAQSVVEVFKSFPSDLCCSERPVPDNFSSMRFWERGLETARIWYHEEWEGSWIQLCLARDIARIIEIEVKRVEDAK